MKSILQLESVAYVGELSPEVDRISKKLANVYNHSYVIENISETYDSGINFNFCNETKNLKKEYCENDKVLKVYLNKQDYFAIPGLFSGKNTYDKFYNNTNIVFENFSLKDNLTSNINKGVVLETHDISNESSIINEFSYIFEALEENNEINEISFQSIKDKLSSAKDKASKNIKKGLKSIKGKEDENKNDAKEINQIINDLIKIQDAKSNKDLKADLNAEDFGMTDHLKAYINTSGLSSNKIFIESIANIFTEYFISEGSEGDAQKAVEGLLKKINKSKDFKKVKNALEQFINSKKENSVTGLIVSAKEIQDKLQEIYENMSNPDFDSETQTTKSTQSRSSKKANKTFRGAASVKNLEKIKKDLKRSLKKAGFFKSLGSWIKELVAAAFNFISLLYKNKTKTMVVSAFFTGISSFLSATLNKTSHFIVYCGKVFTGLSMRLLNMKFENMESLDKIAGEASGVISNSLEKFFTLSVEILTNPVYLIKDNIESIEHALVSLEKFMPSSIGDKLLDLVISAGNDPKFWNPYITIYQSIVLLILISYLFKNFTSTVAHLVAIFIGLANLIYQAVSPATRKLGVKSLDFSGVFNHINLIKTDQSNSIGDFVKTLLSGTDGIDGRIGQGIVLRQTVLFANMLRKQIEEFEGNKDIKIKQDSIDKLTDGKAKLDNLIKISNEYLEKFDEDFKELEEINKEIKTKIKNEVKESAKNSINSFRSQVNQL